MDRKSVIIVAIFFVPIFFGVLNTVSGASQITKNLFQGITDPEVIVLQKFLNLSPDTLVSTMDSGSIGLETDYFGSKTKDAVIRFQNKYASEILTPIGLSYGTGYVGSLTRQKIDSILNSGTTTNSSNIFTTIGATGTSAEKERMKAILLPVLVKKFGLSTTTFDTIYSGFATTTNNINTPTAPVITKITPEILNDGEVLTMYGTGFTDKNTILLSIEQPNRFQNIPSTDGGTKISIPLKTVVGEMIMTAFQKNLSYLDQETRSQVINNMLIGYRKDNDQKETTDRNMLVKTVISVQNQNGQSNYMEMNINIFKEIF